MYPKLILYIVSLCAVNLWTAVAQDNRVDELNALLKNTGWLSLNRQDIDDGQSYSVKDLLAPSSNGQVVTSDNVEDKIRQVYTLIGCHYGRMLMNYNHNVIQLGNQCFRMNDVTQALSYLNLYFQSFTTSHAMLTMMISVFSYFHKLSPLILLEKDFFGNMVFLRGYFARKMMTKLQLKHGNDVMNLTSIRAEYLAIKKFLTIFDSFLRRSLVKNCWPKPSPVQKNKPSVITDLVTNMSHPAVSTPEQAFGLINKSLKFIIAQVTKSYYTELGFIYDKTSKITKVK